MFENDNYVPFQIVNAPLSGSSLVRSGRDRITNNPRGVTAGRKVERITGALNRPGNGMFVFACNLKCLK